MRTFLKAAAFAWPSIVFALAVPSRFPQRSPTSDDRELSQVVGTQTFENVDIDFEVPCEGCFVGTKNGLTFALSIDHASNGCGQTPPIINGLPLATEWHGDRGTGRDTFTTKLTSGLGDREVDAVWESWCAIDVQVLSFAVKSVGQTLVKQQTGFTASFSQDGRPKILRLRSEPTDPSYLGEAWFESDGPRRLTILPALSTAAFKQVLDAELHQFDELRVDAHKLHKIMHDKVHRIKDLVKQDFRSSLSQCDGLQCVFRTTVQKVPEVLQLVFAHFSWPKHQDEKVMGGIRKQGDAAIMCHAANETRSTSDLLNLLTIPPPPTETSINDIPPPPFAEPHLDHPPPILPPPPHTEDEPPHHGEHPPPPPPFHQGPPLPPGPPHDGDHPPRPPPYHDDHPPPPGHGPPTHRPPFHHPHHHHHQPFRHTIKRVILLALIITIFALIIRHIRICCSSRTSRNPARISRCQHRRSRRAAARQRWSQWWSQYRRPRSNTDYDEKRDLILQQESVLESAMQAEIATLRTAEGLARGLAREMVAAEEGRGRLSREANGLAGPSSPSPVELDARSRRSSASYSPPPPRYSIELEGDMYVVDGFRYSPNESTTTFETAESSVVDCSPRMSCETVRSTCYTREGLDEEAREELE